MPLRVEQPGLAFAGLPFATRGVYPFLDEQPRTKTSLSQYGDGWSPQELLGGTVAMTYQQLAKAVSDAGFFTTGDFESKLICASKLRPEGGYTGNSFWVAQRSAGWFLGTWGVHVYRIPEPERVAELCIAWLRRHPDGTASDVDTKTREDFHLVEIDPDDLLDE